MKKQALTPHKPLWELGTSSDDSYVDLSPLDLESHIHILGSPGEGQSKLLELLCRHCIDNQLPGCLIDPSDNGDTVYKVLKYAIKKGYEKIILIDPHDILRFQKTPTLNPIHYKAPAPAVAGNIMDSIRILWNSKDTDTPRIQKYLPAILTALHQGNYTLPDAECLMDRHDSVFKSQRMKILYNEKFMRYHRLQHAHLVGAFSNMREYDGFMPTINRLIPFMDPTMKLIFGSREGIDFKKLIAENYLILVVADPEGVFGIEHQRLLCTIIINELLYAISRLRDHGWRGNYHLYIDEAGDYATSKLATILDKKRKSGLRLALSHQRFDQFADRDVASAIYTGTKIKVLFNTASRDDRDKMIKMMYGGDLSDREVSWTLGQLKKQYGVLKNSKQPPQILRFLDIPDTTKLKDGKTITKDVLNDFKKLIYAQPEYRSLAEVREEMHKRFAPASTPKFTGHRRVENESRPAQNTPSPTGKSIFDDYTDRPAVLRATKRRPTSKDVPPPSKA